MHNYIKTDNFITFFPSDNSESYVIPKSSYYFDLITPDILETIGEFKSPSQLKQKLHRLETDKERSFLDSSLAILKAGGLSGLPLLNFWDKLLDNVFLPKDRLLLLREAVSGNLVITWDGKVVLNSRSSYLPKSSSISPELMNQPFSENTYFHNLPKPAIAGSITWASNHCPDAGDVYEVLVSLSDLILPLKDDPFYSLRAFTYLDKLKVSGYGLKNVEVTTNNSPYGSLFIRKPHDLHSMHEYLKTLVPGNNYISQPQVVPLIATGC